MQKMKKCAVCGNEIANSAKTCPSCGAKQKTPIWKKWWVWAIVVVVVAAAGVGKNSTSSDSGNTPSGTVNVENTAENSNVENATEESIVYEEYEVSQLVNDLSENALAAEEKYDGKYLEISGKLSNVDSDGAYIGLKPANNEFTLTSVLCYIKNSEQKSYVASLKKDDSLTVRVKIKSVGEVLGYSADIIEFVEQ